MKKLMFALALVIATVSLHAQGPDTHYFGNNGGKIYWRMDYDNPISQADLAKMLEEKGILTQMDASKPGLITAKLPMHPVRYDGAGIRPEHAEILLTAAQVSGDVAIRFAGGHYHVTVDHLVLQMSRPSTQENISGTHPFEYHFAHQWGIIRNSMFNTYLGAALDFELNELFIARKPGEEHDPTTSSTPYTPPTATMHRTVSTSSSVASVGGDIVLPQGVTAHDLRTGNTLSQSQLSSVDGFYGEWKCRMFDSDQFISFVCFKPEAFQTQIVSAEREAADSTEALCRRYQAVAGINGSYFNMKELTAVTFVKDEGNIISAENQDFRSSGLVAVDGTQVRIVPVASDACNENTVPEPDGMVSGPMLIEKGSMQSQQANNPGEQNFSMRRHPRSVIGKDSRGAIWLIVVDGRAPGQSEGMSIMETAALCWKLGLTDALNLDGGGSSTLWVQPAGVINHPCDNKQFDAYGQRVVPNAILVQ